MSMLFEKTNSCIVLKYLRNEKRYTTMDLVQICSQKYHMK